MIFSERDKGADALQVELVEINPSLFVSDTTYQCVMKNFLNEKVYIVNALLTATENGFRFQELATSVSKRRLSALAFASR